MYDTKQEEYSIIESNLIKGLYINELHYQDTLYINCDDIIVSDLLKVLNKNLNSQISYRRTIDLYKSSSTIFKYGKLNNINNIILDNIESLVYDKYDSILLNKIINILNSYYHITIIGNIRSKKVLNIQILNLNYTVRKQLNLSLEQKREYILSKVSHLEIDDNTLTKCFSDNDLNKAITKVEHHISE